MSGLPRGPLPSKRIRSRVTRGPLRPRRSPARFLQQVTKSKSHPTTSMFRQTWQENLSEMLMTRLQTKLHSKGARQLLHLKNDLQSKHATLLEKLRRRLAGSLLRSGRTKNLLFSFSTEKPRAAFCASTRR